MKSESCDSPPAYNVKCKKLAKFLRKENNGNYQKDDFKYVKDVQKLWHKIDVVLWK